MEDILQAVWTLIVYALIGVVGFLIFMGMCLIVMGILAALGLTVA